MPAMVIWVVEIPREGYKIRKIFGKKSTYSKENFVCCELTKWGSGTKYQNRAFKVNFLHQNGVVY